MLPTKEISRATERRFEAYDSGELDQVLSAYTDDIAYWDTKTKSGIKGKADLQRYLGEFFSRFDTRFAVLEEHRLKGIDGAIVLWECAVRRRLPGGVLSTGLVMQRGMDLFLVRAAQICRDESYMDLASLDTLFASSDSSASA